MNKFVFKYFFDFIGSQKKWLNEKAAEGFRLVEITPTGYIFEECDPSEYVYEVIYRGYQRKERSKPYMDRLLDSRYNVFIKGMNRTISSDNLKRLYEEGKLYDPKFSPRHGYKDILIVEKKNDEVPFEGISQTDHNMGDLKQMRTITLGMSILFTVLIFSLISSGNVPFAVLFSIFLCVPLYMVIRFTRVIKSCLMSMLQEVQDHNV